MLLYSGCRNYVFVDEDIVDVRRGFLSDCIVFWECSLNNSPHDWWCHIESETHARKAVLFSFKDNCLVRSQGFVHTHLQICPSEVEYWIRWTLSLLHSLNFCTHRRRHALCRRRHIHSVYENLTQGALSIYSVEQRPLMESGPLKNRVPPQSKEVAIHCSVTFSVHDGTLVEFE